jgi:hypothetical protein
LLYFTFSFNFGCLTRFNEVASVFIAFSCAFILAVCGIVLSFMYLGRLENEVLLCPFGTYLVAAPSALNNLSLLVSINNTVYLYCWVAGM